MTSETRHRKYPFRDPFSLQFWSKLQPKSCLGAVQKGIRKNITQPIEKYNQKCRKWLPKEGQDWGEIGGNFDPNSSRDAPGRPKAAQDPSQTPPRPARAPPDPPRPSKRLQNWTKTGPKLVQNAFEHYNRCDARVHQQARWRLLAEGTG